MSIFQEIIHFLKYATMTKHATSRIELHDVSDFIMLTFDRRHFGKNILLIYMYLILRILSEMNISWQIEEVRVQQTCGEFSFDVHF